MTFSEDMQMRLAAWQQGAAGLIRALSGDTTISWQDAREAYVSQLDTILPAQFDVKIDEIELDGIPTLRVTPKRVEEGRVLFYIHGGGYVHGGARAYRNIASHYANRLNAVVYIPDYRQAPEHPFPIPVEDTFRAYRALLKLNPQRIAISGDSAGGAMLITIMRKARDAGIALPHAGVSLSPWADLSHSGESARSRNQRDNLSGDVAALNGLARIFLGRELASHPDASPIHADMRGLPPVFILIGENEVMLSGAITLAERLADQRVRIRLDVYPDMFHVWPIFAGYLQEADEALDDAAQFILREFSRVKQD